MGWRPKDWKNPYKDADERIFFVRAPERAMDYEAGADAILEAYLKSEQFEEDASEYCREQGWSEPT